MPPRVTHVPGLICYLCARSVPALLPNSAAPGVGAAAAQAEAHTRTSPHGAASFAPAAHGCPPGSRHAARHGCPPVPALGARFPSACAAPLLRPGTSIFGSFSFGPERARAPPHRGRRRTRNIARGGPRTRDPASACREPGSRAQGRVWDTDTTLARSLTPRGPSRAGLRPDELQETSPAHWLRTRSVLVSCMVRRLAHAASHCRNRAATRRSGAHVVGSHGLAATRPHPRGRAADMTPPFFVDATRGKPAVFFEPVSPRGRTRRRNRRGPVKPQPPATPDELHPIPTATPRRSATRPAPRARSATACPRDPRRRHRRRVLWTPAIWPSTVMKIMSSGMRVFFIQNS
jgi:hypothetical protein